MPGERSYRSVLGLPLSLALAASYIQQPIPERQLHLGEIDLCRNVRDVPAALRAQAAVGQDQPSEDTWNSIKDDIFKGRPILDGAGFVVLDAPRRADDAAVVPIGMHVNFTGDDKRTLQSLTLVIDENPAPVAGTFTIGPHSGVTSISTRVRVNSYSYVRAVAELSDGKLYGVKAYVKASGGCSAPASSNSDATK